MGDTYARMTVHVPPGIDSVDAIVDAGATFTKISGRTARRVGLSGRR